MYYDNLDRFTDFYIKRTPKGLAQLRQAFLDLGIEKDGSWVADLYTPEDLELVRELIQTEQFTKLWYDIRLSFQQDYGSNPRRLFSSHKVSQRIFSWMEYRPYLPGFALVDLLEDWRISLALDKDRKSYVPNLSALGVHPNLPSSYIKNIFSLIKTGQLKGRELTTYLMRNKNTPAYLIDDELDSYGTSSYEKSGYHEALRNALGNPRVPKKYFSLVFSDKLLNRYTMFDGGLLMTAAFRNPSLPIRYFTLFKEKYYHQYMSDLGTSMAIAESDRCPSDIALPIISDLLEKNSAYAFDLERGIETFEPKFDEALKNLGYDEPTLEAIPYSLKIDILLG